MKIYRICFATPTELGMRWFALDGDNHKTYDNVLEIYLKGNLVARFNLDIIAGFEIEVSHGKQT